MRSGKFFAIANNRANLLASLVVLLMMPMPASAAGEIQLFPPSNMAACNSSTALMFDGVNPVSCNSPIPPGAVMMFDLPACPSGWSDLPGLAGRVLIGSGDYSETSPGSNPTGFSMTYTPQTAGGAAQRSLTTEQMPRHSHPARFTGAVDDGSLNSMWTGDYNQKGYVEWDWTFTGGAGGNYQGATISGSPAPVENPATDRYGHSLLAANGDGLGPFLSNGDVGGNASLAEGQAEPVDTRMPYYVVKFCRKN